LKIVRGGTPPKLGVVNPNMLSDHVTEIICHVIQHMDFNEYLVICSYIN
jgi:hypothetical protein